MALGRQHPVLSPVGCLGGLTFIFGVTIALLVSGGAIFNPGELTAYAAQGTPLKDFRSHAEFENDCIQCHAPFYGVTADRCEQCHVDVAAQRGQQVGLHGQMKSADIGDCAACHRDHRGRDFDPNLLALKRFDHSLVGFSLAWHFTGYDHAPMKCDACHTQTTFTIDPAACLNCHDAHDPAFMAKHTQAFGTECRTCHDGVDKMHNFDHAQTAFALEGRHAAAECTACHIASVAAQAAPTDCAACHLEPPIHTGVFGANCGDCHTPAAWKPARLEGRAEFDHDSSNFKLANHSVNYDGSVFTCRTCHTAGDFSFAAQTCTDCHGNHDAAFMAQHLQDYGPNCVSCHDGAGNMSSFDHNQVFPLDGSHATLECAACHVNQEFKGTPSECSACHTEPEIHAGLFGLDCVACHTATAWAPAQLTRHTFPLDHGGQGEIACETCHADSYVTYSCYGCHDHDPAQSQQEHADLNLTGDQLNDCAACHATGQKQEGNP